MVKLRIPQELHYVLPTELFIDLALCSSAWANIIVAIWYDAYLSLLTAVKHVAASMYCITLLCHVSAHMLNYQDCRYPDAICANQYRLRIYEYQ